MSLYGPPPNVSVAEALYLIFSHYCSPWKSPISNSNNKNSSSNETGSTLDTPPEGDLFVYLIMIESMYII
jgi:hypothetical protein